MALDARRRGRAGSCAGHRNAHSAADPAMADHARGQGQGARTLGRLRDGDEDADVDAEMSEIEEANEKESDAHVRDLFQAGFRPLLLVGVGLALAQQFVGVNTVIYYAPSILSDTGLGNSAALAATMLVGVTNLVFTLIAVLLLDRVGRRALLLTGTAGILLSLLLLGIYFASATLQQDYGWLALGGLMLFIASFAIGLGPVFWLMISEIFPVGLRSPAMSLCTIVNWGANFLVAQTFLTRSQAITRQGVFYLYAGLAVVSLVFFSLRAPETKGRSLEDIQGELVEGGSDA